MGQYERDWFALIGMLIIAFAILGSLGVEVYRSAPPIFKALCNKTSYNIYVGYE